MPLQWKLGKRERVFEDDVFIENTCLRIGSKKKTQDEIYADVLLRRLRDSPGQWFPETDYLCASAIFVVGTSGIPPKLNYRSVKSYKSERKISVYFVYVYLSIYHIHHIYLFI